MKEITLTQEKTALVDDDDYEKLSNIKWYAHRHSKRPGTFYVRSRTPAGGKIFMHHVVLGCPPLGLVTDHLDGNGLNNQKENLRHVTPRENGQNQKNRKVEKSSRLPGVTLHKQTGKWQGQIRISQKRVYLGLYETEEQAHGAYMRATTEVSR